MTFFEPSKSNGHSESCVFCDAPWPARALLPKPHQNMGTQIHSRFGIVILLKQCLQKYFAKEALFQGPFIRLIWIFQYTLPIHSVGMHASARMYFWKVVSSIPRSFRIAMWR